MPLNDDALTTVTAARAELNQADADAAELERKINAASRAIRLRTERQFFPKLPPNDTGEGSDPVALKFSYSGDGYLSLAPYELRSVTSVVMHTDLATASWVTLNPQTPTAQADYKLWPRNRTLESTYLWMTLPERCTTYRRPEIEITITGRWGAGVVPADVEDVCLMMVTERFRNPEGFQSRDLGGLQFTEPPADPGARGIPQAGLDKLVPYCRSSYGS